MIEHECPETRAVCIDARIIAGCDLCLPTKLQQGDSASYERSYQQRHYAKDLIQPNQPGEFVKAYGADKAREYGYSESQIRKYG
jgi:hypothetical protein